MLNTMLRGMVNVKYHAITYIFSYQLFLCIFFFYYYMSCFPGKEYLLVENFSETYAIFVQEAKSRLVHFPLVNRRVLAHSTTTYYFNDIHNSAVVIFITCSDGNSF